MKHVVVSGRGTGGSWKIRGEQLGKAISAEVSLNPKAYSKADILIWVKRIPDASLAAIRKAGVPLVWDIVDAWPQLAGSTWERSESLRWLRVELDRIQPQGMVFPTSVMRADAIESGWSGPSLVLPHHAWPKYEERRDFSEVVSAVGYEGGEQYLGSWREVVERHCRARGWKFLIGQGKSVGILTQCQIGVALRDGISYPAHNWKSNVKLANIQAQGIPAICSREYGYAEFSSGFEFFIENERDLEIAFDLLSDRVVRERRGSMLQRYTLHLDEVALRYRSWLNLLNF